MVANSNSNSSGNKAISAIKRKANYGTNQFNEKAWVTQESSFKLVTRRIPSLRQLKYIN